MTHTVMFLRYAGVCALAPRRVLFACMGGSVSRRNERVLEWVVNKVTTEYADDVCLLVVYGSHVNRMEGPLSDVDFYYVPASARADELCKTYIIEGVGYDLFPIDWRRLEGLAAVNEPLLPLLGDGVIAYCRSEEDGARFAELQATLRQNLANATYMHGKAVAAVTRAAAAGRKMRAAADLGECRLHAGRVLLELADALAYANQTYYRRGLKGQYTDLAIMPHKPDGFLEGYLAVIRARTVERIVGGCERLIARTAGLVGLEDAIPMPADEVVVPQEESGPVDYAALAEGYGELISSFNKTYAACDEGNVVLAFISAVCLQETLNAEFSGAHLALLEAFDAADLPRFRERVAEGEAALVAYIERGATIRSYATVDEFLREH